VRVGPHRLLLEPPDSARIWWVDDIEIDHIRTVIEATDAWLGPEGGVFTLADLSRMGNVSSETRQVAVMHERSSRMAALACIGASFKTRVLLTMMGKALGVLRPAQAFPVAFFGNEASALAWLDAERAKAR
jgi:hypothetical protein